MTGRIAGAIPELLIEAVQDGNTAGVKALLQIGADYNERDNRGRTALMIAAGDGNMEIVRLLLDSGAEMNDVTSMMNWTALHFAANSGKSLESLRLLIERGARTGIMTADGDTAESLALIRGHTDMVQLLKDAREGRLLPDIDRTDIDVGAHLAAIAQRQRGRYAQRPEVASAPAADKTAEKPAPGELTEAVKSFLSEEEVVSLLERGADINERDESGATPLFWAIVERSPEMVEMLLKKGADVTVRDNNGVTPLLEAVYQEKDLDACLLVNYLPEDPFRALDVLTAADKDGKTAFDRAEEKEHRDIAALLESATGLLQNLVHHEVVKKQQKLKARAPKPNIIRGARP